MDMASLPWGRSWAFPCRRTICRKSQVKQQRLNPKFLGGKLLKDLLCFKRTVVVAYARMVAPHDEMSAAVIFPDQGVKDRLARTGIPHPGRIERQQGPLGNKVMIDQGLVALKPHFGRDIVGFGFSHQG